MTFSDNQEGISEEILKKAGDYIKELLKNKKLPAHVQAQLEIQSYFLMFMVVDHEKISQMYPFYKKQAEKQKKWADWWNKLQWVAIPLVIAAITTFIGQFIYFWMVIVPKLTP